MPLYDPLLAQQYGGQEAYESLVANNGIYRPDAFTNMTVADQLRYFRNTVVATSLGYIGLLLEAKGFTTEYNGLGPVAAGGASIGLAVSCLASNAERRLSYKTPVPNRLYPDEVHAEVEGITPVAQEFNAATI